MSTQVKHRRGSQSEIDVFTPAVGEIIYNTTTKSIHIGDGSKVGGYSDISDLSQAYIFSTVALFKSSLIEFPAGKVFSITEDKVGQGGSSIWDVVLTSSVTPSFLVR